MATPVRDAQRSLQAWHLLNESFRLFTIKLRRNQQWLPLTGRLGIGLEERRELNDAMGQCVHNVAGVLHSLRTRHLRLDVGRLLLVVEQGQLEGELVSRRAQVKIAQGEMRCKRFELLHQINASKKMALRLEDAERLTRLLEERHRQLVDLTMDKSELYNSRAAMLFSRAFDLNEELINTKMRINSFENACAQLKRRIRDLEMRGVLRRRQLCDQVQRLRMAQQQWQDLIPPLFLRMGRLLRGLWDCVGSMALVRRSGQEVQEPAHVRSSVCIFNLFLTSI